MKIDQWLLCNLSRNVAVRLDLFHLFLSRIVAVDVGSVMLVVMQLHDLAGDSWLKGAIVIYMSERNGQPLDIVVLPSE